MTMTSPDQITADTAVPGLPEKYARHLRGTIHVPAWLSELGENDYFQAILNGETKLRLVKSGAVKLTDSDGDVEYYYRGCEISFHESISSGYWGRWSLPNRGFTCLVDAVKHIDKQKAEKD
jgi:hypothetical protein